MTAIDPINEIAAAASALPRSDQLLLSLVYVDGLHMAEVAHVLGLSGGAVELRQTQTLAKLRADHDGRSASARR